MKLRVAGCARLRFSVSAENATRNPQLFLKFTFFVDVGVRVWKRQVHFLWACLWCIKWYTFQLLSWYTFRLLSTDHPVPDDMVAASEAMDTLHKYLPKEEYNSVEIRTTEMGDLTIGAMKEAKRSNDWTAINGFILQYLGIGTDDEENNDDMSVESITRGEATVEAIYNTSGMRIATLQKGINLLRMSDGTTVKVVVK